MQVLIFGAIALLFNYKSEVETQELKTFGNRFENVIRYSGISLECYLSFLFWSLLLTHCMCIGLLLYLATFNDTHTHTHTQYSVSFLWTSDQLVVETCIWKHTTLTIDSIHASGAIRTLNPNKRAVANLRHRPREHQRRQNVITIHTISRRWYRSDTPDLYLRGARFDSQ